jgi:hypothetical protein
MSNQQIIYEITVRGVLDVSWQDFLDGLSITIEGENTILRGSVPDQPALYGIVNRLRDLGLELIAIERKESE